MMKTKANPFYFLKETHNHPYARIRRSYLSERFSDTWHIMGGRVSPESLESWTDVSSFRHYTTYIGVNSSLVQSFGVVDYISLGLFPLLHVILHACDTYVQSRKNTAPISELTAGRFVTSPSPSLTTFLSWSLILVRTIINCIRDLTVLALTLMVFPLVLIVHGTFNLIDQPSFRKEKPFAAYRCSKFDIDDVILVDVRPKPDDKNVIPFALYVIYDGEQYVTDAGWYHEDRLGRRVFNSILFNNSITIGPNQDELKIKELTLDQLNTRAYDYSFTPNSQLENGVIGFLNSGGSAADFSRSLRLYGCNQSDRQIWYLTLIFEDPHGTPDKNGCAERGKDISIWKINPSDVDTMRLIKTFIEYNTLGITSDLENKQQYDNLQEQFTLLQLNTHNPQNS